MTTTYILPQPSVALVSTPGHLTVTGLKQLPPWQQLRLLRQRRPRSCPADGGYPTLELRGDRAYLRALRAAELTAWEDGQPATSPRGEPFAT